MIRIEFKYEDKTLPIGGIDKNSITLPLKQVIDFEEGKYIVSLVCYEDMGNDEAIMLYKVSDYYFCSEDEFYLVRTMDYPREKDSFDFLCIMLNSLGVEEYEAKMYFKKEIEKEIY